MSYEFYEWKARFNQEGLTYGLRSELLELLKPNVGLRSAARPLETISETPSREPASMQDLVDWEIVLNCTEAHEALKDLKNNQKWEAALFELLPNLTSLLLDALDLMRQLEGADEKSDKSYWHHPSIADHPQNQKFRDWTALIDLTRDAFQATVKSDANRARAEVQRWLSYPYPLFRRLAFYAAAETNLFSAHVAVHWILMDDCWWLWSVETEREAIRLLVKLAKIISTEDESLLLSAIARGPPRAMFTADLDDERFTRLSEREVWLRLSKYSAASNKKLVGEAANVLSSLSTTYPDWRLAPDESDEFPVWMGEPEDWYKRETSPAGLEALQDWLLVDREDGANDNWSDRCKEDFDVAILALAHLGQKGKWPIRRWRTALQVWSDQTFVVTSWHQLHDVLSKAPDDEIKALAQPLSWWLQVLGKVITEEVVQFHDLIRRLLLTQTGEPFEAGRDPLFNAINHPVGQATDALFRWWYRQELEDNQGLGSEPRSIFTLVCNRKIESYRYGRIVIASNLIPLFRVDLAWTQRNVLQAFDWSLGIEEARSAWSGFLWAPRLHLPLFAAIKSPFLDTVNHYSILGESGSRYANLLTFVALESPEPFSKKELAFVTAKLPAAGLDRCALSLVQGLESAGEKREEYWKNRVQPYLKEIWPKSIEAHSRAVSNAFARLCMKAGEAFPDALSTVKPWLSNAVQGDVTLHQFRDTGLAKRFPDDSLTFLDAVLGERSFYLANDLNALLNDIRQERPSLQNDPRFERLTRYARQVGG